MRIGSSTTTCRPMPARGHILSSRCTGTRDLWSSVGACSFDTRLLAGHSWLGRDMSGFGVSESSEESEAHQVECGCVSEPLKWRNMPKPKPTSVTQAKQVHDSRNAGCAAGFWAAVDLPTGTSPLCIIAAERSPRRRLRVSHVAPGMSQLCAVLWYNRLIAS